MHERIKALRKTLGLTQREFAERMGVKQNTIATYETGRNEPIDAVISLICREFGCNEIWLRTGAGEMFAPLTQEEEIARFLGRSLRGGDDTAFRQRFLAALAKLTADDWAALERIAQKFLEAEREIVSAGQRE